MSVLETESPITVKAVLKQMDFRNRTAAVDVYGRACVAAIGIILAAMIFVFAPGEVKFAALMFLGFPTGPALLGIAIDYSDAKASLLNLDTED